MSVTSVGSLLAELNLTPQKPLQRAYQRDPEAIERWQRDLFPALARQAKAHGKERYGDIPYADANKIDGYLATPKGAFKCYSYLDQKVVDLGKL